MTPPKKPVKPSERINQIVREELIAHLGLGLHPDVKDLEVSAVKQFLDEQHEAKEGV